MNQPRKPFHRAVASLVIAAMCHLSLQGAWLPLAYAQAPEASKARAVAFVVVGKAAEDAEAATVLQSLFRQSTDKLLGVELASLAPVRNPEKAARAAAEAQLGEEALALDPALSPDFAKTALQRFRTAADLLVGAPGSGDMRLRAWAEKGVAVGSVLSNERDVAARAVRRSVLLYPGQTAAEWAYSPTVRELYESVLRDMATETSGKIEVTTEPAGAEVRVAGELKGYSPLTLTNLSVGEHYLEVKRDGHYVWGQYVEVRPGESTTVEALLAAAPVAGGLSTALGKIDKRFSRKSLEDALQSLKTATNASDAVIARVSLTKAGQFEVDGFHHGRGGEVTPIGVQLARDATFLSSIQAFVAGVFGGVVEPEAAAGPLSTPRVAQTLPVAGGDEDIVIDPNSPLFKKTGEEEERITDKWWFWTLIGVGAAGVALAIALPLTLTGEEEGQGPTGDINIQLQGLGN
jgi:hypothetical protein